MAPIPTHASALDKSFAVALRTRIAALADRGLLLRPTPAAVDEIDAALSRLAGRLSPEAKAEAAGLALALDRSSLTFLALLVAKKVHEVWTNPLGLGDEGMAFQDAVSMVAWSADVRFDPLVQRGLAIRHTGHGGVTIGYSATALAEAVFGQAEPEQAARYAHRVALVRDVALDEAPTAPAVALAC